MACHGGGSRIARALAHDSHSGSIEQGDDSAWSNAERGAEPISFCFVTGATPPVMVWTITAGSGTCGDGPLHRRRVKFNSPQNRRRWGTGVVLVGARTWIRWKHQLLDIMGTNPVISISLIYIQAFKFALVCLILLAC